MDEKTVRRFWGKVNRAGAIPAHCPEIGACWDWTGYCQNRGYGSITVGPRPSVRYLTHRFAWLLTNGAIPEGLFVLHRCDNRRCCNPEHLFLGDTKANADDMMRKGRGRYITRPGEAHGYAKLTEEAVRAIRRSVGVTDTELGRRFGVHRSTIRFVRNGATWKHLG